MRAITAASAGGPEVLRLTDVADPAPGPHEVLIEVVATAVNRADLLQRQGFYPPPPGASPILGLECAGRVAAVGAEVLRWEVGDEVCALLPGGGYAELAVADADHCLPVPEAIALASPPRCPRRSAPCGATSSWSRGSHPVSRC